MEPTYLNLHNFLSFREESIDLNPISCAAMVGENGSGKSSLLDAVTWALFGQATKGGARELDNYVTRGEPECRVELQLRLNGDLYKVVRGRSIKRNKSTLEAFIHNGSDWQPISEKNITETQKKIEDILRMDYRTFTASALVLQGQSDSFTANMTDQERKEALGRILGLDIWDRMQDTARERARDLKGDMAVYEEYQKVLQETVADKDRLVLAKKDIGTQLETLAGEIEQTEGDVAALGDKVRQKGRLESDLANVDQGIGKVHDTLRAREEARQLTQDQIQGAEKVLREAQGILAGREKIEAAVAEEAVLTQEEAEHEKKAQQYMELSQKAQDLERKVSDWDRRTEKAVTTLETQIEASQRLTGTLDRVPCDANLKRKCPLLTSAVEAHGRVKELRVKLQEWNTNKNPFVDNWKDAVKAKDVVCYSVQAHKEATAQLHKVKQVSALKSHIVIATSRVTDIKNRIEELRTDAGRVQAEIAQLEDELKDAYMRQLTLRGAIAEIEPLAKQLAEAQENLSALRSAEAEKRTTQGRIEQSLELVAKAEEELRELEEQLKQKREQLTVYEMLDKACGKKAGVPALIVENAVPEIERLCNDMLSRMAGGRLAVRLDTQVEGKSTGTMQEVLRITVLDGGTERPYQTYSGAERFMVDLALRVALSKFLAHRAGAEIRLFVLDEGLGSCDDTNRQAVMDAIQTVSQEFGKVIVITHIAELQDALPQRIEVVKRPEGSKVQVA